MLRVRRRVLASWWLPVVVLAVPFAVAAIRLISRHWVPVLDMAMTELRVRDVGGRHTPLIGLPGRIGTFPDQGSHPGPLSFMMIAPLYRLFGSSAWAMLAATCVIAVVVLGAALAVARRLGGTVLRLGILAVAFVLVQGYGLGVLTQPWNPYFPLLFWFLAFVAAWAVLAGDDGVLWLVVVAGCVCAQTHISYLLLAVVTVVLAIAVVAVRAVREPVGRRHRIRVLAVAGGIAVVAWIPPLVDQLRHTPGNISMLRDNFQHPTETVLGFRHGASLLLRHLDIAHFLLGSVNGSGSITVAAEPSSGPWPGIVLVVLWAASAIAAWRMRHRRLIALHVMVAVTLLVGWISAARIFGKVWFYLTLWAWTIGTFAVVAVVWTAVELVRRHVDGSAMVTVRRGLVGVLGAVSAVCGIVLVVHAVGQEAPEQGLSDSLRAVIDPTVAALRDDVNGATGTAGRYTVLWNDAYFFGSQGYGLVSELERRGFAAGSPNTWRVPLTRQRVIETATATAVVQFATGSYIQHWLDTPTAVEVAHVDLRTPAEVAEFDRLHAELIAALQAAGLDDLVPLVDVNLFGVQLDPRVPVTLQRTVNRMLELGEPTAVFIVPPDVYVDG
ncbi:MAG: hypothetical protein JWM12_4266 [Ilumatobacteraceae bacterium]|nr:hypothetical protein [Ilumatobacteraceae bacterium]